MHQDGLTQVDASLAGGAPPATGRDLSRLSGLPRAQPIYVTSDPGNANRLFVVEREGKIELVQDGADSTFADLSSVVSCCEGERGLLSIALAPDFDSTGRLLTSTTPNKCRGRSTSTNSPPTGATKRPTVTLRNLLTIPHPIARQTTTAASSSSAPTATSTSRPATAAAERPVPQRPGSDQAARQDPPHPPESRRSETLLHDSAGQPVPGCDSSDEHDLELRPAQSVPLLLRPAHRRHGDRRRRPGRT